mmetsp:Transcript_58140/g.185007  ORF Transcript_58140/g.185007 Transcript_58140/m.185007 type:complete len:323 (+) Transcript_58140:515-1483(+)
MTSWSGTVTAPIRARVPSGPQSYTRTSIAISASSGAKWTNSKRWFHVWFCPNPFAERCPSLPTWTSTCGRILAPPHPPASVVHDSSDALTSSHTSVPYVFASLCSPSMPIFATPRSPIQCSNSRGTEMGSSSVVLCTLCFMLFLCGRQVSSRQMAGPGGRPAATSSSSLESSWSLPPPSAPSRGIHTDLVSCAARPCTRMMASPRQSLHPTELPTSSSTISSMREHSPLSRSISWFRAHSASRFLMLCNRPFRAATRVACIPTLANAEAPTVSAPLAVPASPGAVIGTGGRVGSARGWLSGAASTDSSQSEMGRSPWLLSTC